MRLRVALPMPPTDNDLYTPLKKRGKTVGLRLSDVAKAYKFKVAEALADAALLSPDFVIEDDVEYAIELVVYFAATHSKGWPGTAKHRFRKIDSHNRLKLVIDSVMGGVGLDDSCLFEQNVIKQCDPDNPRIEVELMKWWVTKPAPTA
jgi:Holliday junction resolvase RusA-like endonuclease